MLLERRLTFLLAYAQLPSVICLLETECSSGGPCAGQGDDILRRLQTKHSVFGRRQQKGHSAAAGSRSRRRRRQQQPRPQQQPWQQPADPDAPWMSWNEQELLGRLLHDCKTFFEFGSGGSTVLAVRTPGIVKIHTVENGLEGLARLRKQKDLRLAQEQLRITFSQVDLGPVHRWAFPRRQDEASASKWGSYSEQILIDGDAHWDVILIDGRFRIACALKALLHIKDPATTKILFHDYWREAYHEVEEFADVLERVDALAVLEKKAVVDEVALQRAARYAERTLL